MANWNSPGDDVFLRVRNPGASSDLVIPVALVCNTPDEELLANIKANSAVEGRRWLECSPPHDGVAVICGSGPSLADHLGEIADLQRAGGHVFALNAAATALHASGTLADSQVICDARERTAALVGPAREHLLASQCHPKCFDAAPDATLWHLDIGIDISGQLPNDHPGYALIGGTSSVGNVALCVAHAMGYRTIHVFGVDSSYRGEISHAIAQDMNAGEPLTWVQFAGREWLCSFTMKSQCNTFKRYGDALIADGVSLHVHGDGLLQAMWADHRATPIDEREARKYRAMWGIDAYRNSSPGEDLAPKFVDLCRITAGMHVIDFGCGTGRGGLAVEKMTGCYVTAVDFAANAMDEEAAKKIPFVRASLAHGGLPQGDVGFCTDVMEHIPPEQVDAVITNIMAAVPRAMFQVSTEHDVMGALIGEALHLSVHPYTWWVSKFESLGNRITYMDVAESSVVFIVTRDAECT